MLFIFNNKEFLYFIFTGGIAAIFNIVSRFIFSFFINFTASILISYLIAMILAYHLAKRFVFKKSRKSFYSSFAIFSLINLLAVLQTLFISIFTRGYLLDKIINLQYVNFISHIIGVITPVFTSFIGHKYFSFKE